MPKLRKSILTAVAILLLMSNSAGLLLAQQDKVRFEHISWEKGLSQVTVRSILRDNRGVMWFATADGLNKYNGYDFTIYRHDATDTSSLCSSHVRYLFEDSNEVLWVGTTYGLGRFDRNTETFTNYYHVSEDVNSLNNNVINAICEDKSGNLWIGTSTGLNKLNRETGHVTRYKIAEEDSANHKHNHVNALARDEDGNLWVATARGLNHFNVSDEKFTRYEISGRNAILTLFINSQGTIWLGTSEGLSSFDPGKEEFFIHEHPSDGDNHVYSISEDEAGRVWFGTLGDGLFTFDPANNAFMHYMYDSKDPNGLCDNAVMEVFIDESGYIWLGTFNNGINKINSKSQNFTTYQQTNKGNSLKGKNVWGISEDSAGMLWVATARGLNKYNRSNDEWTLYAYDEDSTDALDSKGAWSFFEDKSGTVWVGKSGSGLINFNRQTEKFSYYQDDPAKPENAVWNAWKIVEDKEGLLWVTTVNDGLKKIDRETGKITHYTHDPADTSSLSGNYTYDIYIDPSGIVWLATNAGLNSFDKETETFTRYVHQPEVRGSLSSNDIWSIHAGEEGTLWIGTNDGLNKFDKTSGISKVYQEKDGLSNNVIYGIQEDNNGHLWMSTNKGLSRFNPETETFKNYDARDGLQSNEFSVGAHYKDADGQLYFGGINGFNVFHPDSIKSNTEIPPIIITDFQIFNKSVAIGENAPLQKHISEADQITLSYKHSVFSFEFAALNYTSPEKNKYAYMLEGFDQDWYHVGDRRFATYTNIPPGTYTFRVKGSNNDGVWNEEGASIKLTIVPPFWQTTWFYLLLIILIALLIVTIFQLRLRNLKRVSKLLEKQVNQQTKELFQEKERVLKQNVQLNNINEELKITLKDLQDTQTQLVQSEKMASLGQLTAGVAHEINNPVNFISAGIDSLKVDYEEVMELLNRYRALNSKDTDQQSFKEIAAFEQQIDLDELLDEIEQLFNSVKEGAVRTKEIVKSLQSFSRMDDDNLKKANLNDGIEATLVILQSSMNGKVEVIKDYATLPEIDCHPGQINQVFMNILSNAVQAVEGGGTIKIVTQHNDDYVVVKISDSGTGIPQENIPKVFDPFFTTKEVGKGTGLGLSIAYGIVTKHQGKITVDSKTEEGTTFTVALPVMLKVE